MLGVIPKSSWYCLGDASESERFAGRLATGDIKRDKADIENYSTMHLMDNLAREE